MKITKGLEFMKIYEIATGHGEIIITKKEKRGSYIVCRMFDCDGKAKREATKMVALLNKN